MSIQDRFKYKTAIGFSLGVIIVIVIEMICSVVNTGDMSSYFNEFQSADVGRPFIKLMLELLTGGLLGAAGNGGAVVYEIEEWSILRCTLTHFFPTMCIYSVVALFNGWLTPYHSIYNVIQVLMMVVAYFIIWMTQYLIYKKEVAGLNEDIESYKMKRLESEEMTD